MLILLISNISAFAVSSQYYEGYPMYVPVGETREVQMTLQNLASSEDVSVRADITSGEEIIEIIDSSNEYVIPAGGKTTVKMRVTIPSDARLQDAYNVNIQFITLTTSESGQFGLASGIDKGFKVIVGTGLIEEKPIKWGIYLIIGLIALFITTGFLVFKKRKKKS